MKEEYRNRIANDYNDIIFPQEKLTILPLSILVLLYVTLLFKSFG